MKKLSNKNSFTAITLRSHEQIASAIKRIRKLYGLSQMELAKKTGLTQATISRVESANKKTEIGTIFLILTALNSDLQMTPRPKSEEKTSLEGLF